MGHGTKFVPGKNLLGANKLICATQRQKKNQVWGCALDSRGLKKSAGGGLKNGYVTLSKCGEFLEQPSDNQLVILLVCE